MAYATKGGYNPHRYTRGLGFLRVFFQTRNTVVPEVLKSGFFWFIIVAHIIFQFLEHMLHYNFSGVRMPLRGGPGGSNPGLDDFTQAEVAEVDTMDSGGDFRARKLMGIASRRAALYRRVLEAASSNATAGAGGGADGSSWFDGTQPYAWDGLTSSVPGIDGLPRVDWRVATVTLSLMVFFLVFYTVNEYQKYNTFFSHTIGISGGCMEWVALVNLHLPPSAGEHDHGRWNATRYVLASMQIMYYAIHGTGVDMKEWAVMMKRGILGLDEVQKLIAYPGNKPWLCLCWAIAEVEAQLNANALPWVREQPAQHRAATAVMEPTPRYTTSPAAAPSLPPPGQPTTHPAAAAESPPACSTAVRSAPALLMPGIAVDDILAAGANGGVAGGGMSGAEVLASRLHVYEVMELFREVAFGVRGSCGQIANWRTIQVPFPYFHLLNLLVLFNLVMISYAAVPLTCWPLSLLAVFAATFTILGMRCVAIALSDPFGHDLTDFALEPFMKNAYEEAVAQLQMPRRQALHGHLPPLASGKALFDPVHNTREAWLEAVEMKDSEAKGFGVHFEV